LKTKLSDVKDKLDDAMKGEKPCPTELGKISEMLDEIAKDLLEQIKGAGGGTLGAVS
jgi:hypothetical protein